MIPLFMNDNDYLVVFENKKSAAHDVKEFLLFTPCYQLPSTSIDTFSAVTMNIEESGNDCQVPIQFVDNNKRAFCIHTFINVNYSLRYMYFSVSIIQKNILKFLL